MKKIFFVLCLFSSLYGQSQYSTPGIGIVWNLDSLVNHSNGAVTFLENNTYQINEDLTIEASDSFEILNGATVKIATNVLVTFSGNFTVNNEEVLFTAVNQNSPYRGFRFEESAGATINQAIFEYGGGIKVITSNFHLENSIIRNNSDLLTIGAVIEFSHGMPEIIGNTFENNVKPAISSAGNASVSPQIINNLIQNNNTSNSNRPQINLGPSEGNIQTLISNNIILGSIDYPMVGGIASSTLLGGVANVRIENNEIRNNRYGIALLGNNQTAEIINNQIIDNNTQGIPLQGGSGINLNALTGSSAIISSNTIEGNLWGITVQGTFAVNLGSPEVEGIVSGHNSFSDNGNEGNIYALYNNTALDIEAPNNCWDNTQPNTLEIAESVIFHNTDDSSLGTVIFDPIWDCYGLSVEETVLENKVAVYPNPAKGFVNIKNSSNEKIKEVRIVDLFGKKLYSSNTFTGQINLENYPSGIIFITLTFENGQEMNRIIIHNK